MDLSAEELARIGDAIEAHIREHGLEYAQVAAKAGITVPTLAKARRGERIRITNLRRVGIALGWAPEGLDQAARGEPPSLLPPAPPGEAIPEDLPPFAQGPPVLTLRGSAPLRRDEELMAWDADDGERYYWFRPDVRRHPRVSVSAPYAIDRPMEEVLRRMRTAASAALI